MAVGATQHINTLSAQGAEALVCGHVAGCTGAERWCAKLILTDAVVGAAALIDEALIDVLTALIDEGLIEGIAEHSPASQVAFGGQSNSAQGLLVAHRGGRRGQAQARRCL